MGPAGHRFALVAALAVALVANGAPAQAKNGRARQLKAAPAKPLPRVRRHRAPSARPRRSQKIRHRLSRFRHKQPHVAKLVSRASVIALDIDNTVVDTRPRTVAAVRQFAATYRGRLDPKRRARMRAIRKADVGWDGAETAARLGLRGSAARELGRIWTETFWNPKNVALDTPVPETLALVRQAKREGKQIVFITGRNETLRPATVAQLRRLGLLGKDVSSLHTKTSGTTTPAFKRTVLRKLTKGGKRVLFVDDSKLNIDTVDRAKLGVDSLFVAFPVQDPRDPAISGLASMSIGR